MGRHPLGVSRVELQEVILRGLPVTVVVSVTRVLLDPFHFSLPAGPATSVKMETNVQSAAEVIPAQTRVTPPQSPVTTETQVPPPQAQEAQHMDPMEEFGRQLEEIISTYGSAASLMEKQCIVLETEEVDEEASREQGDEVTATKDASTDKDTKKLQKALGKEGTLLMQSLNKLHTPQEKLDALLKKYAELLEERRGEQKQLRFMQKKQGHVGKERDQLQYEHSRAILARSKLEGLCRELQRHNKSLKPLGHQAAHYGTHLSPSLCAPACHRTHLDSITSLITFPIYVTPFGSFPMLSGAAQRNPRADSDQKTGMNEPRYLL